MNLKIFFCFGFITMAAAQAQINDTFTAEVNLIIVINCLSINLVVS